MDPTTQSQAPPPSLSSHAITYPRFLWKAFGVATDGGIPFYLWMTVLTAVFLVGMNAWSHQIVNGMGVTNLTDHVSWGIYIGNFTYMEGIAAGAVMMVIPAFLYRDRQMYDVVIIGQILAIAAIIATLAFVVVDLGRIDRSWHLIPGIGRFNWPISMLSWDVVVLNGYLVLNLHVVGYMLYSRFQNREPTRAFYLPFVIFTIIWTVFTLSVCAFLYTGLGGRPYWNNAILGPRFVISSFVTGPAFLVLALQIIRRLTKFHVGDAPINTLIKVLRVTVLANLFMVMHEVFAELYAGSAHSASVQYLYFGLHGHDAMVPWIWTAMAFNIIAAILLLFTHERTHLLRIDVACVLLLVGLWIEKALALIIPAFVPSTLHEMIEYMPNALEWKVSLGLFAMGLMIFTLGVKLAVAVFTGEMKAEGAPR